METWLILLLVFIAVIFIVGQPEESDPLSMEVSPGIWKRGIRRTSNAISKFFGRVEEAHKYTPTFTDSNVPAKMTEEKTEKFELMGETYPEVAPRIDVFDEATIGSDAAAKLHTKAFVIEEENRRRSLRLSEPEVVRERIAGNLFLWTGDYKGREQIQSNPFVKRSIINPSELTGGVESRII